MDRPYPRSRLSKRRKNNPRRRSYSFGVSSSSHSSDLSQSPSPHTSESEHASKAIANSKKKGFFPCNICDKVYTLRGSLDSHLKIHKPDAPRCQHCDKPFTHKSHLDVHLKSTRTACFRRRNKGKKKKKKPRHPCQDCSKTYGSATALKAHSKIHGIDAPKCETCGKLFPNAQKLEAHGNRKIPCVKKIKEEPPYFDNEKKQKKLEEREKKKRKQERRKRLRKQISSSSEEQSASNYDSDWQGDIHTERKEKKTVEPPRQKKRKVNPTPASEEVFVVLEGIFPSVSFPFVSTVLVFSKNIWIF